jgi:hypothetical protein
MFNETYSVCVTRKGWVISQKPSFCAGQRVGGVGINYKKKSCYADEYVYYIRYYRLNKDRSVLAEYICRARNSWSDSYECANGSSRTELYRF